VGSFGVRAFGKEALDVDRIESIRPAAEFAGDGHGALFGQNTAHLGRPERAQQPRFGYFDVDDRRTALHGDAHGLLGCCDHLVDGKWNREASAKSCHGRELGLREGLLEQLDAISAELARLRRHLEADDPRLVELFEEARAVRERWAKNRNES